MCYLWISWSDIIRYCGKTGNLFIKGEFGWADVCSLVFGHSLYQVRTELLSYYRWMILMLLIINQTRCFLESHSIKFTDTTNWENFLGFDDKRSNSWPPCLDIYFRPSKWFCRSLNQSGARTILFSNQLLISNQLLRLLVNCAVWRWALCCILFLGCSLSKLKLLV